MASLDRPLPASWTVRQGLDVYLAENGFTKAAYDDPMTDASIFGIGVKIPNTLAHRRAIMRHDLHHVATGFGTDLRGEAEISAWEIGRGLSSVGLYVGAIVWSITALGVVMAPFRLLSAYKSANGKGNLFQEQDYESLLDMTIGDLRKRLGIPEHGLAGTRELHSKAPVPVSA